MNYVTDPAERERNIRGTVHCIAGHYDPDQAILFGSHARRAADEQSDVDFLVVLRAKPERTFKATADVYRVAVGCRRTSSSAPPQR